MNLRTFASVTLDAPSVAVCVGCGGVGKTTVAAALAVEGARRGQRVLVLTIDPARRLADALGVAALGNEPQDLPREALTTLGVPEGGNLAALMLDMKRTFDDLVERFADSPESRDRILQNSIYQHASDALSGSVEYSAMEKVFELYESGRFDLIVVDTPPAQHALDFLEAPQRLVEFLESKIVQVAIHPTFSAGRFGFRLFQRSTRRVLRVIERISGIGFLEDISEFLLAFEGMARGFRERAEKVRTLLLGPKASFVLVTGAGRESVEQAGQFLDRLESFHVRLQGVLVNRLHLWPGGGPTPDLPEPENDLDLATLATALAANEQEGFPAEEAARLALETAREYAAWVRRDERAILGLRERTEGSDRYWGQIPELDRDVHDLTGLTRIADLIFHQNGGSESAEAQDT